MPPCHRATRLLGRRAGAGWGEERPRAEWEGGTELPGLQGCRGRPRAARGEGCDVRLPGMRLLLLLPEGGRCPRTDLTQPGDGRYLQLLKPQCVSCFYFWVPRSPGMN